MQRLGVLLVTALLLGACGQNALPAAQVARVSQVPLPTYTSYPTYTPQPVNTPYPTYTLQPVNTPYPTHTPYPTYTPYPTGTPYPTHTDYPTPTPPATATPGPTASEIAATPTDMPAPTSIPAAARALAPPDVRIVYILFDGEKGAKEPDEYCEIRNVGTAVVNLDGWRLNAGAPGQDFRFPPFELAPEQTIRVYTDEVHVEYGGFSFAHTETALWANKGDCGYLYDAGGEEVSRYCY